VGDCSVERAGVIDYMVIKDDRMYIQEAELFLASDCRGIGEYEDRRWCWCLSHADSGHEVLLAWAAQLHRTAVLKDPEDAKCACPLVLASSDL
jgi:hypothetical protein